MSVSPTENDNIENTESKISDETGSDAGSPAANEGVKADSPPADEGAQETLVDRIKKAADGVSSENPPGSKDSEEKEADPNAKPEGQADEEVKPFTKEDLPSLHSKTRKRVEKLLGMVDEATQRAEQYQPAAEQYAKIVGYMKANEISFDDMNKMMAFAVDVRNSPQAALDKILPLVEQLQLATGAVLPEDLATQVKQGFITEAHAQELAKHRADAKFRSARAEAQHENDKRQHGEEAKRAVQDIERSITQWESKWASSDPDYQKKRNDVQEAIELELARASREGKLPKTSQEAVELAEKCKKKVEAKFSQFLPAKQEVRHVSGGSSAGATTPFKASTLQEVILHTLNG